MRKKKSAKPPVVKPLPGQSKRGWRQSQAARGAWRMAPAAVTIPAWLMARLPKTKAKIEKEFDKMTDKRIDYTMRDTIDFIKRFDEMNRQNKALVALSERFNSAGFFERRDLVKKYGPEDALQVMDRITGVLEQINQELRKANLDSRAYSFDFSLKNGFQVKFKQDLPREVRLKANAILEKNELLLHGEAMRIMYETRQAITEELERQSQTSNRFTDSTESYVGEGLEGIERDINQIKFRHYRNLALEVGGVTLGAVLAWNLALHFYGRLRKKARSRAEAEALARKEAEIRAKIEARKQAKQNRLTRMIDSFEKKSLERLETAEQAVKRRKPWKASQRQLKLSERARRKAAAMVYQQASEAGHAPNQILQLAREVYPITDAKARQQKLVDFQAAMEFSEELNVSLGMKTEYIKSCMRRGFANVPFPKEKLVEGKPKKVEVFSVRDADRFVQRLDGAKYVPVHWIKSLKSGVNDFHKLPEALAVKAARHLVLYTMAQGGMSKRMTEEAIKHRSGCNPIPQFFNTAFQELLKEGVIVENRKGRSFYTINPRPRVRVLIQKYSIKAAQR